MKLNIFVIPTDNTVHAIVYNVDKEINLLQVFHLYVFNIMQISVITLTKKLVWHKNYISQ